jgi:prefoldin subunit 5
MKSSVSQIKNSAERLSSRLEQIEDRTSGYEDKIDVLEHEDEDKKTKEILMEHLRPLRHH